MWYHATMTAKPVQVSIDTDLLARIDDDPEARTKGRSAFIRSAVVLYLEAKERRDIEARIAAAYGGQSRALQEEVADLVEAQAWPGE